MAELSKHHLLDKTLIILLDRSDNKDQHGEQPFGASMRYASLIALSYLTEHCCNFQHLRTKFHGGLKGHL